MDIMRRRLTGCTTQSKMTPTRPAPVPSRIGRLVLSQTCLLLTALLLPSCDASRGLAGRKDAGATTAGMPTRRPFRLTRLRKMLPSQRGTLAMLWVRNANSHPIRAHVATVLSVTIMIRTRTSASHFPTPAVAATITIFSPTHGAGFFVEENSCAPARRGQPTAALPTDVQPAQ